MATLVKSEGKKKKERKMKDKLASPFQKTRSGFPRLREEGIIPQADPPILGSTRLFWELDQRVPHG